MCRVLWSAYSSYTPCSYTLCSSFYEFDCHLKHLLNLLSFSVQSWGNLRRTSFVFISSSIRSKWDILTISGCLAAGPVWRFSSQYFGPRADLTSPSPFPHRGEVRESNPSQSQPTSTSRHGCLSKGQITAPSVFPPSSLVLQGSTEGAGLCGDIGATRVPPRAELGPLSRECLSHDLYLTETSEAGCCKF